MIIPIRCFTCNRVIASKYRYYQKKHENVKSDSNILIGNPKDDIIAKSKETMDLFKEIGLDRYCCKRMVMTHIDLINKV